MLATSEDRRMTQERLPLTRNEILARLKQHGIEGSEVYLIDLIPLIETAWADGALQEQERTLIDDYLQQHVKRINLEADQEVLSLSAARAFVRRFVDQPNPELMKALRAFVSPLSLSRSDDGANNVLRESLLAACIDIAAASVTDYPYAKRQRFNAAEKRCLFEIIESLG